MTNRFYFADPDRAEFAARAAIRCYLSLAGGTPRLERDGRVLLAVRQMHPTHAEAFAASYGGSYAGSDGSPLEARDLGALFGTAPEQVAKLERRLEVVRRGEVPASFDREAVEDEAPSWRALRRA